MSKWVKCSLGCGISHRADDSEPVHDAQWASTALRTVLAACSNRGIIVVIGKEEVPPPVKEVVN